MRDDLEFGSHFGGSSASRASDAPAQTSSGSGRDNNTTSHGEPLRPRTLDEFCEGKGINLFRYGSGWGESAEDEDEAISAAAATGSSDDDGDSMQAHEVEKWIKSALPGYSPATDRYNTAAATAAAGVGRESDDVSELHEQQESYSASGYEASYTGYGSGAYSLEGTRNYTHFGSGSKESSDSEKSDSSKDSSSDNSGGESTSSDHSTSSSKSNSDSEEDDRVIQVLDREENMTRKWADNKIKTSYYTAYNFLILNLFDQMHKVSNQYFTIIALIQLIPSISPVNPWSSLIPLFIVMGATAFKEAVEDYRRHKSDGEVNHRSAFRVNVDHSSDDALEEVLWADVVSGDILCVRDGDFSPADVVLLATAEEDYTCTLSTKNLDGETNLKSRSAISAVAAKMATKTGKGAKSANDQVKAAARVLGDITGTVTVAPPNDDLEDLKGSLQLKGYKNTPFDGSSVLLRGCRLVNTDWVLGCVIYTGHDTKVMMNTQSKIKTKHSKMDNYMNRLLKYILVFELTVVLICAILSGGLNNSIGKTHWYLEGVQRSWGFVSFAAFWTFLILYSAVIPISLYVSVEMVKVGHALLINWDNEMLYHDQPAHANTSNLSEELGQVEYIFSDKTGTLTRNMMVFRKCVIGGKIYGQTSDKRADYFRKEGGAAPLIKHPDHSEGSDYSDSADSTGENAEFDPEFEADKNEGSGEDQALLISRFVSLLALCHACRVAVLKDADGKETGVVEYQSPSPDDVALVKGAKKLGYEFLGVDKDVMRVRGPSRKILKYKLLNMLEFNSDRKRMSVIVEDPDGNIMLLSKGADNIMFDRLSPESEHMKETTVALEDFAVEGLRTLVLCYKDLDPEEYEEWNENVWNAAQLDLKNRDKLVFEAAAAIETDLLLLGATAIEDRLQDGVPDSIATLARAGIRIWVLTGDKQETAINIGYASALLTHNMDLVVVNAKSEDETLDCLELAYEEAGGYESSATEHNTAIDLSLVSKQKEKALIVDGKTLGFVLRDEERRSALYKLTTLCSAVIFCRVFPKHKGDVVRIVRDKTEAITLAIGDGANDVPMIRAAHVGVGISGQEGRQAVMASDIAFAQFRFLQRLLLVHGRWSYNRLSKLLLYSFYKNFVFNLTQLWFNCFCAMSGHTLLDDWFISVFNLAFTGLPIMVLAIFDQDISDRASILFPQLYKYGQGDEKFNGKIFLLWLLDGTFQSLVCFFVPFFWLKSVSTNANGRLDGLQSMGSLVYVCIVIVANMKIGLMTQYWTWVNHLIVWSHLLGWFLFAILYHLVFPNAQDFDIFAQLSNPGFYLVIMLVCIICLLPAFTYDSIITTFYPTNMHIIREFRIPSDKSVPFKAMAKRENILAALIDSGNMQAFKDGEAEDTDKITAIISSVNRAITTNSVKGRNNSRKSGSKSGGSKAKTSTKKESKKASKKGGKKVSKKSKKKGKSK